MKFCKKIPHSVINRHKDSTPPWGPCGYIVTKRTYCRLREDLGRSEEWLDVVSRCIQALLDYGMAMSEEEVSDFFDYWYNLKCMTAGRGLWQLGTKTVERLGGASLMNCYFREISSLESFCFIFDNLMLGGGVGFSVLPTAVHKLPPILRACQITRRNEHDVDFIVPDNREGWVELLRKVLHCFFTTGKDLSYSTVCVRGKGVPIRSFGGVASGPEELVRGINQISKILQSRAGKHLRPIDALDICNIIGSVVVAGNVRRSAQIAIGYASDEDFLSAKNWASGTIPNWRAMSNNTCACSSTRKLKESFWYGFEGTGEAYGLFNLNLCRSHGRISDGPNYRPDPKVKGINPCGEQPMADGECCDLVENIISNYQDRAQFIKGSGLVYKAAKTMLTLPFHWPETQAIVEENMRMGIGITGVLQSSFNKDDFTTVYRYLEELDHSYSKLKGLRPSIKLTTVKPSGTLSLLPGVTPGGHPAFAEHYIRRIRFASDDPLVELCRARNHHVEPVYGFDGKPDHSTMVVSFPVKSHPSAVLARDTTALSQLETQKMLQTYWSDNAVSSTVYYRKEELPAIKDWLHENYSENLKSGSFLLHQDHGFNQAPLEEIPSSLFEEMSSKIQPITSFEDLSEAQLLDSLECQNGLCPVR